MFESLEFQEDVEDSLSIGLSAKGNLDGQQTREALCLDLKLSCFLLFLPFFIYIEQMANTCQAGCGRW